MRSSICSSVTGLARVDSSVRPSAFSWFRLSGGAVVRRYFGKGVEADDLYQLGCLGFLKAVRGFDAAYGTQFSTYAVPKIAGEIRRYLRDNPLRPPPPVVKRG